MTINITFSFFINKHFKLYLRNSGFVGTCLYKLFFVFDVGSTSPKFVTLL